MASPVDSRLTGVWAVLDGRQDAILATPAGWLRDSARLLILSVGGPGGQVPAPGVLAADASTVPGSGDVVTDPRGRLPRIFRIDSENFELDATATFLSCNSQKRRGAMPVTNAPMLTYAELIKTALDRYPSRTAFMHEGQAFTYARTADLLGRMMRVLAQRGLRPGDGLAVLSGNRPEAWLAATATLMLGGRYTALHPLGSLEDFQYVCTDAEIHTLVVDPRTFDEKATALAQAVPLTNVLALGPSSFAPDLLHLSDQAAPAPLAPEVAFSGVASVLYTGGTTGRPKGVVHLQRAWSTRVLTVLADFQLPACPRYLAVTPITHAAGMMIMPTLLRGGTVVLNAGFDPERFLRTIATERINLCFGVPTMIYVLLDHPALDRTDLSGLETFLYAAAPMSPARLAECLERIGPIFTQYYGQTESGGMATVLTKQDHDTSHPGRLASCGHAVSSVRLQIQDETGAEVPEGETGEICLRGAPLMEEYWKQPVLTAETLRGGWLHTGDMATRDGDGFFTIVDRKKDMIVSGGSNVFPREVEDVLSSAPGVAMCAVIGVPDDRWGEAVKAIVVRKLGAEVTAEELIALVRERKGPVYAPKSVDFADSLPLTAVGKADKKALRAPYWGGQARLVH
jgi:fatty-acyl-CoA synthase